MLKAEMRLFLVPIVLETLAENGVSAGGALAVTITEKRFSIFITEKLKIIA